MNRMDAERTITLTVNGVQYTRRVPARKLLADFIREDLGLTGTHVGCEHGVCGACTILLNGATARSCLLFAIQVDGAEITTVEGLARGETLHPIQEAFWQEHGLQCGFCTGYPAHGLRVPQRAARLLRGGDPPRARGQPVPLHRLPEHREGGGNGRPAVGAVRWASR